MFVANVFRTTMKNFELFTGQWQLLSAWCAMLELHLSPRSKNWVAAQLKRSAHFVQRNWHRSPHDLQTEFRGSRPLILFQESRDIVGQSCHCHSGTGWMLLLLQLAATRSTNIVHSFAKYWTDFQNAFTIRLSKKLAIENSLKIPPHRKRVATLPCEI